RVEHAGQTKIPGVARRPRRLLAAVEARYRLADRREAGHSRDSTPSRRAPVAPAVACLAREASPCRRRFPRWRRALPRSHAMVRSGEQLTLCRRAARERRLVNAAARQCPDCRRRPSLVRSLRRCPTPSHLREFLDVQLISRLGPRFLRASGAVEPWLFTRGQA